MIRVFYSYSHLDRADLDTLTKIHMQPLVWDERIVPWQDSDMSPGDHWEGEIAANLNVADLIVLLVSSNFFASRYIREVELKRALERSAQGAAKVVPVMLRSVTPTNRKRIEHLQVLPGLAEPVHRALSVDDAWVRVAEGIERVVDKVTGLDGYPDHVVRELRAFWARLAPGYIEEHLRRVPITPADTAELRSARGTVGHRWPFHDGAIYWSERAGAHSVVEGIDAVFRGYGGCTAHLGFPVTDEDDAVPSFRGTTGTYQRFEGTKDTCSNDLTGVPYGATVYRSGRGIFATAGAIGSEFERLEGTAGALGFPTSKSEWEPGLSGFQSFEGGRIYRTPEHGAYAVTGPILDNFLTLGGTASRFGFPIGAQTGGAGELLQEFTGGAIAISRYPAVPPRRPAVEDLPLTAITAGSVQPGHLKVITALRGDQLLLRALRGDGWSPWQQELVPNVDCPLVSMTWCKRVDEVGELFIVDAEGALAHRPYRMDAPEAPWQRMDTPAPVVAVASGSYAENHQELFIATVEGTVFHSWRFDGAGWWGWTWFPAPSPIRALTCSGVPGELDLFATDDEGRIRHRHYLEGGAWSDWAPFASPGPVTALSSATTRSGHRELFGTLAEGGDVVHCWRRADGWSDWHDFGPGEPITALANASRVDRKLEVFAATATGRLLHRWYLLKSAEWSPWKEMRLPPVSR